MDEVIDLAEAAHICGNGQSLGLEAVSQVHRTSQGPTDSRESNRRKRARNWSPSEVLLLIDAKRVECDKYENSNQREKLGTSSEKWNAVVDFLKAHGVHDRDVGQCKGKWENLLSDYKVIKHFHKRSGRPSYFAMTRDERRKEGPTFPLMFEEDVYKLLDAFFGRRPSMMSSIPLGSSDLSETRERERTQGDREQGSSGKRKKCSSSSSDVIAAMNELSNAYMLAVASAEEKRVERHREALNLERERISLERERMERESRDRRELCTQLGNLANAFNKVADSLKDEHRAFE